MYGPRTSEKVDIFDRFKGIGGIHKKWFKNSLVCDCILHLKEDLYAPKLGNGSRCDVKKFDSVWCELDGTKFNQRLDTFVGDIKPCTADYFSNSVLKGNSNPNRWANCKILHDREGITSIQSNESFHGLLKSSGSKSLCYSALIIHVLNQQLNKLSGLTSRYSGSTNPLPPKKCCFIMVLWVILMITLSLDQELRK